MLNFFNAILTGIIARKREFAVLQSIGMAGKQLKTITLLSGGEKAFVAIALYFAILKVRPTPFCMLDEIELRWTTGMSNASRATCVASAETTVYRHHAPPRYHGAPTCSMA